MSRNGPSSSFKQYEKIQNAHARQTHSPLFFDTTICCKWMRRTTGDNTGSRGHKSVREREKKVPTHVKKKRVAPGLPMSSMWSQKHFGDKIDQATNGYLLKLQHFANKKTTCQTKFRELQKKSSHPHCPSRCLIVRVGEVVFVEPSWGFWWG